MNNKKYVVGNWKMNLGAKDGAALVSQIKDAYDGKLTNCEVWVTPPATTLPAVASVLQGSTIRYGAQNAYTEDSGAFTGEIATPMLDEIGASFVIIGHSERRHIFGESNELIAKRTIGLLKKNFTVILCIGEMLPDREAGKTNDVIAEQLGDILKEVTPEMLDNLILAYEPVWAIGTGKVASTKEIAETHAFIAEFCRKNLDGKCPPILYGGSVKPNNFGEIIKVPLVDGALVGGASISFEPFKALIDIAAE